MQLPSAKLTDIQRLDFSGMWGFRGSRCVSQATMLQPQATINSASEFQHKVLVICLITVFRTVHCNIQGKRAM